MIAKSQTQLPEPFRNTLMVIHANLEGSTALWAITGSLGFWLHGMQVSVNDIDLQTTADGAYQLEKHLRGKTIKPVGFSQTETIRSHYGSLELNGVQVEIMGDVEKRLPGGIWQSPPILEQVVVQLEWKGLRLPVLSLEYEQEAYRILGRKARAEQIAAFLASQT